jgi:hypothetical protein
VTAYAIGEESFNDCNGTGEFVSVKNPANNSTLCPNGDFFVSLGEVFGDYNESGVFDGDFEPFVAYNSGPYQYANGLFIGLLCNAANDPLCDANQTELDVSGQLVIVMSNSNLQLFVNETNPQLTIPSGGSNVGNGCYVAGNPVTPGIEPCNFVAPTSASGLSIPLGGTLSIYVSAGDTALQAPAVGTTISAAMSNGGSVLTPSSYVLPDIGTFGYVTYPFTLKAPTSSTSCTDTLIVSGAVPAFTASAAETTSLSIPVTYTGGSC